MYSNIFNKYWRVTAMLGALLFVFIFASCKKEDEPTPEPPKESWTLLYMVANNSLSGFDKSDLQEIRVALKGIDTDKHGIMIYHCDKSGIPKLYELVNNGGTVEEKLLKVYDDGINSCDPTRLKEVINEVVAKNSADAKLGLILWSHAMGWFPASHTSESNLNGISRSKRRWYGEDGGIQMNITDLADAIPDDLFYYIWADCCYMGNMETAYQLRKKAHYFVGAPTEVLGEGMPYNITLPKLMQGVPDLVGAADALHNYFREMYPSTYGHNTIAVYDLDEIEGVAAAAREILIPFSNPIQSYDLQKYSRYNHGPFYDFRQYLELCASKLGTTECIRNLHDALDRFVIFKRATPEFLGITINPETYSGVSVHCYLKANSTDENFYRQLDWYRDVFPESARP